VHDAPEGLVGEQIIDPAAIKAARAELEKRRGADFRYEAVIGNRAPPLNYRD
jgi:aminobenzoyl-glutamate utilization protein B